MNDLDPSEPQAVALIGPTASGKSAVAMEVARRIEQVSIVSVDSMQVYRGMDIGTAKPSRAEQIDVPHHMIDVAEAWEDYSLARFQNAALEVIAELRSAGRIPLLVGGTGLYLRAVIDRLQIPGQYPEVKAQLEEEPNSLDLHRRLVELDPLAAGRMEPNNRRRIVRALEVTIGSGKPFSSFGPGLTEHANPTAVQIAFSMSAEDRATRIEQRYAQQMEAGFLDEVAGLLANPHGISRTAAQALGYRELIEHLAGRSSLGAALELATSRTRKFARRQISWFRRDPRVEWIEAPLNPAAFELAVRRVLEALEIVK